MRQSVAFAARAVSRFNSTVVADDPANALFLLKSITLTLAPVSCRTVLLIATLGVVVGCDARIEQFEPNRVFTLSLERSRSIPTESASQDVTEALAALFGTPNDPKWPEELFPGTPSANLVDPENLRRAAGPVSSDKDGTHRGLFREHCVVCHGLEGSGTGPASQFQDPYPRDFRFGVFKWKSTVRGAKPTKQNLHDLLIRGVPGTGMPSFSLLAPDDLNALVDYVIYLSVRGEAERRLLIGALDEMDYGDSVPEEAWRLQYPSESEGGDLVAQTVRRIADQWTSAESQEVLVPAAPELEGEQLLASIERGKKYFHGQISNCVGCHGADGNGRIELLDYDDWTKDYTTRLGITPSDREAMQPFRDLGALRPRPIQPRNLQNGVFRGGAEDADLYCRITQGIAGTPMPGVMVVDQEDGKGLTPSQIWDLVHYVQSLTR